jgi:hypothetical protein
MNIDLRILVGKGNQVIACKEAIEWFVKEYGIEEANLDDVLEKCPHNSWAVWLEKNRPELFSENVKEQSKIETNSNLIFFNQVKGKKIVWDGWAPNTYFIPEELDGIMLKGKAYYQDRISAESARCAVGNGFNPTSGGFKWNWYVEKEKHIKIDNPHVEILFKKEACNLFMTILKMDERFRYIDCCLGSKHLEFTFRAQSGITIKSGLYPALSNDNTVYLRGREVDKDNLTCVKKFSSIEQMEGYLVKLKESLREWSQNWEGFGDKSEEIFRV